jgi:erythritol transport system ATP-binding protein
MSATLTDDVILRASQITRVFPGTVALDRVDFNVRRGKVNVLIGENGAGKSTLVKILAGVDRPTQGHILLDGHEVQMHSPRDADAHGIGIIYQELNLFPNLSVRENIFMARHKTLGGIVVDRASEERVARDLVARLQQRIDPDAIVGSLPLGQQQIVEIAKALARDVRILMMDEPTSALSASEIRVLFGVIRELKERGVAIVYISHKLAELLEIGDYVTVLRDGRLVADAPASEIDIPWIVEKMTGRKSEAAVAHQDAPGGREVLRVEKLTLGTRLHEISFSASAGEIVGVYGLLGAGRTELFECIAGLRPHSSGTIAVGGERLEECALPDRIARGVALVPEDRQAAGLVQSLSVRANMTLASLSKYTRAGHLSPRSEDAAATEMISRLRIRCAGPKQAITSLSGGNQQKAVIARYLLTSPKVLLLDEPTRGVDVGARSEIFDLIRQLAETGMAVVFASSDLHEVLTLADRVIVMSRGRITAQYGAKAATEHALVAAAAAPSGGVHASQ